MKSPMDATGSFVWCALATAGIGFWFLVGFPFGHHNESYDWVAWITTPDLASVAFRPFFGAGYRPLAMSTAWALFHAGAGSLVGIQLFNFLLTVAAWWTLALAATERRVFAFAALGSGGVLFAGYIFLFHLHGVFYGPLLLWLAFAVFATRAGLTPRRVALVFAAALVAALFHTFALVLGLAFVLGAALERGWLRNPRVRAFVLGAAALAVLLIARFSPRRILSDTGTGLLAFVTSFQAGEVNRAVSAVCLLFALGTVLTTRWPGRGVRLAAFGAALLAGAFCWRAGIPLTFVWLAAGGTKAALHRRWTLLLLIVASLGLPYAGGSGSPTYALFTIALLTFVATRDADALERRLAALRPVHAATLALALVSLALLVREREIPVLSRLARPVLAERERTHQSERLLRMLLNSRWRRHPVRLAVDAALPTAAGGALDRGQRPPTNQVCLDAFLLHVRGAPDSAAAPVWLTFGGGSAPGERLFVVPGRHAGDAVASLGTR